MEKNQDKLSARIFMKHHVPFNDFLGLTLNDMHGLIMIPLGEHSPIQLREDLSDETLDQIPLFRIVEAYLHIIQRDKHIKLTYWVHCLKRLWWSYTRKSSYSMNS